MTPTPAEQTVEMIRAYVEGYRGSTDAPGFDACVDSEINKRFAQKDAVIERLVEALNLAVRQMTIEDMLLPEEPHLRSALGVAKSALTFAKEHTNGKA